MTITTSDVLLGQAWTLTPSIVVPLVATGTLYAVGWRRLTERMRRPRPLMVEATAFALGMVVLGVALLSPLHEMGESLLSAHMAQHGLLMVVAAPLLIMARPLPVLLWGLPQEWRVTLGRLDREPFKRVWRWLTGLGVACAIHAIAIMVWHLPVLYDASVRHEWLHALQHTSFLATALLFWYAMFHGAAARQGRGATILYITLTSVYTGALGMLLTFSQTPLYTVYLDRTTALGITPIDDQRLAGLIMWIPGGLGYFIATLVLAAHWLGSSGPRRRLLEPGAVQQEPLTQAL